MVREGRFRHQYLAWDGSWRDADLFAIVSPMTLDRDILVSRTVRCKSGFLRRQLSFATPLEGRPAGRPSTVRMVQ
jgi:hypothetical protein